MSTDRRMIEKGSASTTLSADTVLLLPCSRKPSEKPPPERAVTETSSDSYVMLWRSSSASAAGDLIVASPNVEALVGLAEEPQLRPGVAEQVEQVQRALLGRVRAVLDRVGDVEQLSESRRVTTRDRHFDPVGDRHRVELTASPRRVVVRGRVVGVGHVLVDRGPRDLEVRRHLLVRVGPAVEEAEELGASLLGARQVVQPEAQLVDELPHRVVAGVDELATVLDDLPVGEGAAERPATAAGAVRRLVELDAVAGLTQAVGAGQPGEPGADDHDLRAAEGARGAGEPAERGQADRRDTCLLDERPARRPPRVGVGSGRRGGVLNGASERRPCHARDDAPRAAE